MSCKIKLILLLILSSLFISNQTIEISQETHEIKSLYYKSQNEMDQLIKIKEIIELNKVRPKSEEEIWSEKVGFEVSEVIPITFVTTAYSSLPEENGGWTVTCNGLPLQGKIVANNTLPQGTKISLNDKVYTVADKGSSRFNKINRLDVLVEKSYGESIEQYRKRVSNYGVQRIEGYVLKKNE